MVAALGIKYNIKHKRYDVSLIKNTLKLFGSELDILNVLPYKVPINLYVTFQQWLLPPSGCGLLQTTPGYESQIVVWRSNSRWRNVTYKFTGTLYDKALEMQILNFGVRQNSTKLPGVQINEMYVMYIAFQNCRN